MAVSRRKFLKDVGIGAIATAASPVGVFSSPLEALVQSSRHTIGKFSDGYNELGVVEMYSDGMLLTQAAAGFPGYSAEILYFIRKGASKDFGEWSVQANLYKPGQSSPVNTMRVDGSLESGKMIIANTVGPKKDNALENNALESMYTEAAYNQSSMYQLSRQPETEVAKYIDYLPYAIAQFRKDAKPMPKGYNPLAGKT